MLINLNILEILEYNKPPLEPDVHLSVHPALSQVNKKKPLRLINNSTGKVFNF